MPGLALDLTTLHRTLAKTHGKPAGQRPATAFEWVMWDVVPYAPDPGYRLGIFLRLRDEIGMTPAAIAAQRPATIAALAGRNPRAAIFGARAVDVAERVLALPGGDLDSAVRNAFRQSPRAASKLLRAFPGVGEPAADRILALLGLDVQVPLDANGVRIIGRLAGLDMSRAYPAQYSNARSAARAGGTTTPARALELHLLMQEHGRAVCRATPDCGLCSLRANCCFGRSRRATV